MASWAGWVRASVIEADLLSAIAYTTDVPDGDEPSITVHHAAPTENEGVPGAIYSPLARLTRPTPGDFLAQLDLVHAYADLRGDRGVEALAQLDYGVPFFATILSLDAERTRHTLELLAVGQAFASSVAMRAKHALACRRPDVYSAQIQPMIPTPGHGALPSGHATEATFAARLLCHLLGSPRADLDAGGPVTQGDMLMAQAARIAVNRTVAGVHFPADSLAGAALGLTLADYFATRATGAGEVHPLAFDGRGIGQRDFAWREVTAAQAGEAEGGASVQRLGGRPLTAGASAPLAWLWERAASEWTAGRAGA